MIRNRDVAAVIMAAWLTHMVYYDTASMEPLSSTVHLAWYLPRNYGNKNAKEGSPAAVFNTDEEWVHPLEAPPPVMLDLDGDGTPEALAMLLKAQIANNREEWVEKEIDTVYGRRRTIKVRAPSADNSAPTSWKIQLVDLKPAMRRRHPGKSPRRPAASTAQQTILAPFRPAILMESTPMHILPTTTRTGPSSTAAIAALPLHITTGHVKLVTDQNPATNSDPTPGVTPFTTNFNINERNRHYFCGSDWHDAASSCKLPCPGGQASECQAGERCYADTPCDIDTFQIEHERQRQLGEFRHDHLHKTLTGGLPSMFTLWSNGMVTMHSLTGDKDDGTANTKTNNNNALEVRLMWQVSVLENRTVISLEEARLTFLDDIQATGNEAVLLVSGLIAGANNATQNESSTGEAAVWMSTFVTAISARTGKTIWQSFDEDPDTDAVMPFDLPLPLSPTQAASSSMARRRSLFPQQRYAAIAAATTSSSTATASNTKNSIQAAAAKSQSASCWVHYRRSLLTSFALPHSYWSEDDARADVVHFEYQAPSSQQPPSKALPKQDQGADTISGGKPHRSLHAASRHMPLSGRPNVVVSHNSQGLQVRSLKNGRRLCHLSLLDQTVYADLNHDGILDSIQAVTGHHRLPDEASAKDANYEDDSIRFVANLIQRVASVNSETASKDVTKVRLQQQTPLCHVLALSGLPAREELFAQAVCGNSRGRQQEEALHRSVDVEAAPPLVVESLQHTKGGDVVVAVNTGHIHRFDGATGRRQWHTYGRNHEDFPSWDDGAIMSLARIDSDWVIPPHRPILLAGDTSLAILSARNGHVLATARYPQPALVLNAKSKRAVVITDFNGDGTSDVILLTVDGVWGYQVTVHAGSAIFFRVIMGILLCGLLLAILRHRFGPQAGKRSTDP